MAWLAVLWTLGFITCSSSAFLADPPSCVIVYSDPIQNILCEWTPAPDNGLHMTYTLHWRTDHGEQSLPDEGNSSVRIPRQSYDRLTNMSVWVTASSAHDTHTSPHINFLPSQIAQPPGPVVEHPKCENEGVELLWQWSPEPEEECVAPTSCTIRYRTAGSQHWTLEVGVSLMHFLLPNALPFTQYQFQVRCTCVLVMSPWSNVYTFRTPEAAPVGVVDVWTDCGTSSSSPLLCNITWKNLDVSLLRGVLQAFEFREEFRNGTVRLQNLSSNVCESTAGVCICRRGISRLDTAVMCVSAYNSKGLTNPSCINLWASHTAIPPITLTVKKEVLEKGLIAFWATPSDLSDHVQEYVLQRKRAGLPLSDEFDWMRVQRDKHSTLLTGEFRDCTPYEVSLFAWQNNQRRLMASTVDFSRQCVPPEVEFHIRSSHDSATVFWTHTPLKDRRGHVLRYQLLLNGTVHNVSGESTEHNLTNLKAGHFYEVSLWAVTEGGPGNKTYSTFITKYAPGVPVWLLVFLLVSVCLCVMGVIAGRHFHKSESCYVPDPQRSHLFIELIHLWHPVRYQPLSKLVVQSSPLEVLPMSHTHDPLLRHTQNQPDTHPGALLYPARVHHYRDTTGPSGPSDHQDMEKEWLHIPMKEVSQQQEQKEVEEEVVLRKEKQMDSCTLGDYSDSHALDGEVMGNVRRSAEREEEEEEVVRWERQMDSCRLGDYSDSHALDEEVMGNERRREDEEESNYGDGWRRPSEEEEDADKEQEEDSWDFMKPVSDYEGHLPVTQC